MIAALHDQLNSHFGSETVEIIEEGLQPTLLVKAEKIKEICFWLRDNGSYYFDFLANLTAIDYSPANTFGLVYNLTSIPFQKQLTLKVLLSNDRSLDVLPEVESVSSVWRTADWHEREAFDLMGIFFTGHPDLRRILLPDDWEGYPLRKDYQEAEMYHGISIKG